MTEEARLQQAVIEPIRLEAIVGKSAEEAFTHFTGRMTTWWPMQRFTFGPGCSHEVLMEPFVGGRFYERYTDGEEFTIGEVLAWDPPRRVVFTWRGRWTVPTEVTVRFEPQGPSLTRVEVEHAGWERLGEVGLDRRNEYSNGWPAVLAAFAASGKDGR